MAWRVMMPKKISTMFSQDPDVGVKCRVILGVNGISHRPGTAILGQASSFTEH
jgi:hypothetical protein